MNKVEESCANLVFDKTRALLPSSGTAVPRNFVGNLAILRTHIAKLLTVCSGRIVSEASSTRSSSSSCVASRWPGGLLLTGASLRACAERKRRHAHADFMCDVGTPVERRARADLGGRGSGDVHGWWAESVEKEA